MLGVISTHLLRLQLLELLRVERGELRLLLLRRLLLVHAVHDRVVLVRRRGRCEQRLGRRGPHRRARRLADQTPNNNHNNHNDHNNHNSKAVDRPCENRYSEW